MMKKIVAVSFLVCCAAFLLLTAGCSTDGSDPQQGGSYIDRMNEGLVSFTDCANALCDSLDDIADRTYAPSDKQLADIQEKLDRLRSACSRLAGQNAPRRYSEAQSALDEAMRDYADAFDKCDALLEFYGTYDELFRQYKDPVEGSAEIEKQERALYGEFAGAMRKATDSFRTACGKFDSVKQ